MTAAETIQAAIARLTELREECSADVWRFHKQQPFVGRVNNINGNVVPAIWHKDAELIVTLHRTIDAQLALLRAASADVPFARDEQDADDMWGLEIALARAILGGDQ